MDNKRNALAALLALLAFGCFSTHDIFIKQLGASYSAFQIVFFSALLSFPFLTLELIWEPKPGTLRPKHPWWVLLRSISAPCSAVSAFYAFSVLPLSQVYAFIFTAPLIITLLAIPILGEKIRLPRGIAIFIGLIGVLIVLRPGATPIGLGHLAAFIAAFTGAINAIVARKIGRDERSVVLVLYPIIANLIVTAIALPFVYVPVAIGDLGSLAIVSVLSLIAMGLLVLAYTHGDAMIVAPMQYSQMIWATIFGAWLFSEFPDWQTYVGTAIIAGSGLYIVLREARGGSQNTPVLRTRTRVGATPGIRISGLLRRREQLPEVPIKHPKDKK